MSHSADRNLLFGILALQNNFISREQLLTGFNAWVVAKDKALGTILQDQGALAAERRQLLEALVQEHLKQHAGDPQQSLAAVPVSSRLKEQIKSLCHPDLEASLAQLGANSEPDPEATRSQSVGEASTVGQRFRILRPHAEGGLGKVSVALDEELNREVALKEIKERHADDASSRGRFVLEAEITGGLEHPGIVPVYGLGNYADGRPFYAMRFIRGDSLKDAIARFHSKQSSADTADFLGLEFRQLLGRFVDVCNAIAYAHSRGVLHRDLKPGNIMLGKYGETLVVDWGLAKAVGSRQEAQDRQLGAAATDTATAASLRPSRGQVDVVLGRSDLDEAPLTPSTSDYAATVAGTAIGTPAFMSPEQAAGRLDLLGPASDIYSLGATLYVLLTGQIPFREADSGELLRKVQCGDFDWSNLQRAPKALVAVCKKAMALKPEDRYTTPRALVNDIEHWLADEPVGAWPEPWTVKGRRWVARHRVLVTSAAAALVVAVISSITANVFLSEANETISNREKETKHVNDQLIQAKKDTEFVNTNLRKANEETKIAYSKLEIEKSAADKAREDVDDALAQSRIQVARAQFEEGNVALAEDLVELVPAKYRGSAWCLVKNGLTDCRATFRGHKGGVTSVAFTVDGQILASGGADKTVKLWDTHTGEVLRTIHAHFGRCTCVAFSPDGNLLASGSADKSIKLWDLQSGKELRSLLRHRQSVTSIAFTPDGHRLASGSDDETVKLWDVKTGEELYTCTGHKIGVTSVAFTPDGRRLVSGDNDRIVKLWDAHSGRELQTLRGHDAPRHQFEPGTSVDFSPDGQILASASGDGTVRLWDTRHHQQFRSLQGHLGGITSVTFTPDGQLLATASDDMTIKLWDVGNGQDLRTFGGHRGAVRNLAITLDGRVLASASDDGTIKLWDARADQQLRTLRGQKGIIAGLAFAPDGQVLASGSNDDHVKLWNVQAGSEIHTLRGEIFPHSCVAFARNGHLLASTSHKGVDLWDSRTGNPLHALRGNELGNQIKAMAFSSDSMSLAIATRFAVTVWDARNGKEIGSSAGKLGVDIWKATFDSDGLLLAIASIPGRTIKVLDSRTSTELCELHGHKDQITSVAFHLDGRTLASGSQDNSITIWDTRLGQALRTLRGHKRAVTCLAFTPDGQILASGSADRTIRLWDLRTGQELRMLRGHLQEVSSVAFTPDGQMLASGSGDGTVRLWDVRTELTILAEKRSRGWLFLPDPAEHRYRATFADAEKNGSFAAACQLGHFLSARNRLQVLPWAPAGAIHAVGAGSSPLVAAAGWYGLEDGRRAQTAFVDGATFAGILLKDSGRSAKGLVIRAQWAVDQWPNGWRNREVLGGALYRAADYNGAVRELMLSNKLRNQNGNSNQLPSNWSCHFLALAHDKLGSPEEARAWLTKAVLPKNANWDEALIDRFLRREVEPIQLGIYVATLEECKSKLGLDHADTLNAMSDVAASLVKLGRGTEAVPLIDDCVKRASARVATDNAIAARLILVVMELRLRHFESGNDAAGCRATAEMWEKLNRTDARSYYDAACFRAVTAAVIAKDGKVPAADKARLARAEADQAMAWLSRAVGSGWRDAAHTGQDSDLDALRERADFQKLLGELSANK